MQVLLTQRSPKLRSFGGKWVLPGGNLDPGETLSEAGARELREETGLVLDKTQHAQLRPLCMFESTFPDWIAFAADTDTSITHHHVVVYMHVRMSQTAQQLQLQLVLQRAEVAATAWVPRALVPHFLSQTPAFHLLRQSCKHSAQSDVDSKDGVSSSGNVEAGHLSGAGLSGVEFENYAVDSLHMLSVLHVDGTVANCKVGHVAADSPAGTTFVLDQWFTRQTVSAEAGL
jgi:8-oxo-dGTP pyrophosphatase MutT (NUDIX family)